jgi:hypothetical protein
MSAAFVLKSAQKVTQVTQVTLFPVTSPNNKKVGKLPE